MNDPDDQVLTDEAGTWSGALQWRGTKRYHYRCASKAVGAIYNQSITNEYYSFLQTVLFRTRQIKLHCDDRDQGPIFKICRRPP